jgi:DNA-binding transcriptional MerR regulator
MQSFTIGDVERLSGIKAHTLRVWEQRYGLLVHARRKRGHRTYSNEDLQLLLRVAQLYHRGHRISKILGLGQEAICAEVVNLSPNRSPHAGPVSQLLDASIRLDAEDFVQVLRRLELQLGFEQTVTAVLHPLLEQIGICWMNDTLLPAQEHFASHLVRTFIITAIDELPKSSVVRKTGHILLMLPPQEYHEIPLLFIEYLMRRHGHPVISLGCNVDGDVVEDYCKAKDIALIHYHHITNLTHYDAEEYLEHLCVRFPRQRVVVSGGLVPIMPHGLPNGYAIRSQEHLLRYCADPLGEFGR